MPEAEAVRFYQTIDHGTVESNGRTIVGAPFVVRETDEQWPAAQASAKEQERK
jgi:hypothetical protein